VNILRPYIFTSTDVSSRYGSQKPLPNKFSSIDPEGRFFSRVAGDFHDREVHGGREYANRSFAVNTGMWGAKAAFVLGPSSNT
jgi:hypothetical protein